MKTKKDPFVKDRTRQDLCRNNLNHLLRVLKPANDVSHLIDMYIDRTINDKSFKNLFNMWYNDDSTGILWNDNINIRQWF